MTTFSETTLPALIFSVPAGQPKGDVPALGRLTVNEAQAVDQWWMVWGCETNDFYDITATSAALFYEAETRTALGGSATAVGPSGASGGGSNVMRNSALSPNDLAILSTQASGAGSHLSHVGSFRVFCRVQAPAANVGAVTISLEWSVGDFRSFSRNNAQTLNAEWNDTWRLLDLGIVTIPVGLTRWEGRIIASSTATGDVINIDHFFLVPTLASGQASGVARTPAPTSVSALDTFEQTAGNLATKVLPVGGTWTLQEGAAADIQVDAATHIAKCAIGTGVNHAVSAGTATYTDTSTQVDIQYPLGGVNPIAGLTIRYVDASNYCAVAYDKLNNRISVYQRVAAGAVTKTNFPVAMSNGVWYTLSVRAQASGKVSVWFVPRGAPLGSPVGEVTLTALATGGALQTGKVGLWDISTTTNERWWDNFFIWAPASASIDAAVFASQSLEVKHNVVQREDSAGTFWQPVSSYEGDLLRVPPAGREGRSIRFIVKACRNDPTTGADSAIDDISATLAVTPRYLSVPTPA